MTTSAFTVFVATLGAAVAVSSVWSAVNIARLYRETHDSEGALLLSQARSAQVTSHDRKHRRKVSEASKLSEKLEQAGIPLTPAQWVGLQIAACAAVCGLMVVLGSSNSASGGGTAVAALSIISTCAVLLSFRQIANARARSRLLLLEKQLAQVELQIAENSRSGLPISRSILACSELVDEPLQGHLKRMHAELTYSDITLAEGFENIAKRTGSSDARLLASVVSVQQQTGSNLADALGFLHETISRRTKMRQTLRTALAETRITRNIVAVTPWAIFLLLAFAPFVKIQGFWEFYSQNPLGHMILGACVVVELGVLLFISRLSNLELE